MRDKHIREGMVFNTWLRSSRMGRMQRILAIPKSSATGRRVYCRVGLNLSSWINYSTLPSHRYWPWGRKLGEETCSLLRCHNMCEFILHSVMPTHKYSCIPDYAKLKDCNKRHADSLSFESFEFRTVTFGQNVPDLHFQFMISSNCHIHFCNP